MLTCSGGRGTGRLGVGILKRTILNATYLPIYTLSGVWYNFYASRLVAEFFKLYFVVPRGSAVVEQRVHIPRVGGSIPPPAKHFYVAYLEERPHT
jgi:hypothetical protein